MQVEKLYVQWKKHFFSIYMWQQWKTRIDVEKKKTEQNVSKTNQNEDELVIKECCQTPIALCIIVFGYWAT